MIKFLLVNLLFSSYLYFHPIHISITNISYQEEKKQFDISTRLFRDDLELIVNHKYDVNLTLTDDKIANEESVYVNKYLNDMLLFIVNTDTLSIKKIDVEIDNLMIVAKYKLNFDSNLTSLEILNTLMMDAFSDQKNLLIINSQNKEKGYQFTIENYQQKIVL